MKIVEWLRWPFSRQPLPAGTERSEEASPTGLLLYEDAKNDLPGTVFSLLLVAAAGLALWAVLPSFAGGEISSWDGPGHVVRLLIFEKSLTPRSLGIFGLYEGWYLGTPGFLFYPPGFFAVVSLLRGLSAGALSITLATKIVLAFLYVLFPLLIAWLARRLGLSRRAAALAALLSLCFHAHWNQGLTGIYEVGLYTEVLALVGFILVWGLLHGIVWGRPSRGPQGAPAGSAPPSDKGWFSRDVLLGGLALAGVFVTNIVVSSYVPFLLLLYFVCALLWRRSALKGYFALLGIAVLMSFFWIYPFLRSLPYRGPATQWRVRSFTEVMSDLFLKHELFPWTVTLGAVLGLAALLALLVERRRLSVPLFLPLFLVGLTLVVSSGTFRDAVVPLLDRIPLLAIPSRVVDQAYTVRSQQLLWVALPLFGAAGLSWLLDRLRSARPFLTVLPYVLLLGVLVVVLLFRTGDIRERYVHTFENHPVYAARYDEAQKAAEYLRPLVEPTSVVLVYVGKNGGWLPAIDSVIGLGTGARMVGGHQLEAVHGSFISVIDHPEKLHDEQFLRLLSVDYLVM